ncbi:hypothetical protein [Bradyrhizobium liaoningense]|uniref:hypothetical protein n=1 Tax=Bradyrhizobium liaoningense TaxID=43992 RepID=UPI001BADAACB|nr:hypothetical protein [Bradyrhizobium liaoningense]MBR0853209.1 hypothetical protein [Bradyrhizobium liaoningense]
MDAASRRAFLGFATNALAAAAIGAAGTRLVGVAQAMPIDPDLGRVDKPTDVTQAQWGPPQQPGWGPPQQPGWGPPPRPGWRPPPPRRRRRWVCWWHRGRRHCGWRWR